MKYILLIILAMSCLDLFCTWKYASAFHTKFPNIDYKQLEANPVIRKSWDVWGLNKGMLIGGIIVLFLVAVMAGLILPSNWQWYLAGALQMMLVYHYLNWQQLLRLP